MWSQLDLISPFESDGSQRIHRRTDHLISPRLERILFGRVLVTSGETQGERIKCILILIPVININTSTAYFGEDVLEFRSVSIPSGAFSSRLAPFADLSLSTLTASRPERWVADKPSHDESNSLDVPCGHQGTFTGGPRPCM
jgi:hypothetical protein